MDFESPEAKEYLQQLFQITAGKLEAQVSMFEVGEAIGLDKDAAGKVAEILIGDGLVEVKTLSGDIGISAQGIDAVEADGGSPAAAQSDLSLNSGPIVDEDGSQALQTMLSQLKEHIAGSRAGYAQLEAMVIDLKTIEVQLLSPQPKTAIVREVLKSLQVALENAGATDIAERLRRFTGQSAG